MNISIRHINNTYNYGSLMMAISLITNINSKIKNIKFYVDARSLSDLERLKVETGFEQIYSNNINRRNNIIYEYINKGKRFFIDRRIKNVIIIGGDDISEYYGIETMMEELSNLNKESKHKKIFMLGQTIGPFTENRGDVVRKNLRDTKIYTRDSKCYRYLQELKFDNIMDGRDLAFVELPLQNKAKYILKKYKLITDEYITIVPSGLTKSYTNNYEDYIERQISIVSNILSNPRLKKNKIVLLPHVLKPVSVDDRKVISDIMDKIDNKFKHKIIAIYDEILASEAREVLGNGLFTITGRMHAAVSTFYMKKPAICLSYSVKYSGVIGEGLDMSELIIEASNDKLWRKDEITYMVNEKVEYILDNYSTIVEQIDTKVVETRKIVENELDNLVNKLNA